LGGHAISDLTLAYLEQVLKTAVNPRYLVVERRGAWSFAVERPLGPFVESNWLSHM